VPLPSANPFPSPMNPVSPPTALPPSSNGFASPATAAYPAPTPLPDPANNGLLPASSSATSPSAPSESPRAPVNSASQWVPAPSAPAAPPPRSRPSSPYATYDTLPGK
jgi:hypothetical protein